ncbi:MAG: hypothetical protein IJ532_07300 [Alphaproteobacteria bacterium]|nr:hypothetical protein [Alphaproteobacteria bacterium]
MSEDSGVFDGKVSIRHVVEYYEEIDAKEYYLRKTAYLLNDDEFKKVTKYIERITQKRIAVSTGKLKTHSQKHRHYGREKSWI